MSWYPQVFSEKKPEPTVEQFLSWLHRANETLPTFKVYGGEKPTGELLKEIELHRSLNKISPSLSFSALLETLPREL